MAIKRNISIDAVLSEDVARLIDQLGLRDRFERGDCCCHICNDTMDYTNLKLIFPMEDQKVGFLCNKPQCFAETKEEAHIRRCLWQ